MVHADLLSQSLPDFEKLKKILFLGAGGVTGFAFITLLKQDGKTVYGYDNKIQSILEQPQNSQPQQMVTSEQLNDFSILDKVDAVTLSPGVPLSLPVFAQALKMNIPVFTELEYVLPRLPEMQLIAVTGTDGKSTTTRLVEHILNKAGRHAVAAGNIGLAISRLLTDFEQAPQIAVLELSSYQLELARNLKPDVAVYLNLAADHLNRYSSLEEYGRAKFHIAGNQDNDDLLIIEKQLMIDDQGLFQGQHPAAQLKSSIATIDNLNSKNFKFLKAGDIYQLQYRLDDGSAVKLTGSNRFHIQGAHNFKNILFALEACHVFLKNDTLEKELMSVYAGALETFRGLPHRFEVLKTPAKLTGHELLGNNRFINDSKATTTQAVLSALENVSAPLFIFMGGQGKNEDYSVLVESLSKKNSYIFLYGAERFAMQQAFETAGLKVIFINETLDQVYKYALNFQKKQELTAVTFLLAPAVTSWDQYTSFEARGDHFKQLVNETGI